MKADIHPKWHNQARVVCACGNTFVTGSTKSEIRVEICSRCHPFFTGEKRLVDTLGQVERFMARQQFAAKTGLVKKADKKKMQAAHKPQSPRTLREMLLNKQ